MCEGKEERAGLLNVVTYPKIEDPMPPRSCRRRILHCVYPIRHALSCSHAHTL
jgi:hypothetical protein